jgi:hypothetical protein
MVRIGTGNCPGPAQVRPVRDVPGSTEGTRQEGTQPQRRAPPASEARALVLIDGGQSERTERVASAERPAAGKPRAGFIAHLLTAGDPALLPSRLERTRMAAACYAEAARRLA